MSYNFECHQQFTFTHEVGPHRQLAFLDTEIYLPSNNECVCTSKVFRKMTNIYVFLNYNAICPCILKICLINSLLNRVYNVCSIWLLFHQEISFLKNIFHTNGYPHRIFHHCGNKFLNNKLNQRAKDQNSKKLKQKMHNIAICRQCIFSFQKSSYHTD